MKLLKKIFAISLCAMPILACSFEQEENINTNTEMVENRCEPVISSGFTKTGSRLILLIKNTGPVACPLNTNGVYMEVIKCNRPQPGGQNYNCVVVSRTPFSLDAAGSGTGAVKTFLVPIPSNCSGPGAPLSPNGQVLRGKLSWHYAGSSVQQVAWASRDYNCQ